MHQAIKEGILCRGGLNTLRFSPKYSWNTKSKEGIIQLTASVSFLSENFLLEVLHYFEWNDYGGDKRSEDIVTNVNNKIDSYSDFRKYEPFIFPEDWEE